MRPNWQQEVDKGPSSAEAQLPHRPADPRSLSSLFPQSPHTGREVLSDERVKPSFPSLAMGVKVLVQGAQEKAGSANV